MSKKIKILLSALIIFLIILSVSLGWITLLMKTPVDKNAGYITFNIPTGASFYRISKELEENGLISSHYIFSLWIKIKGLGNKMKAGEYSLSPSMPPLEILGILKQGRVATHTITIPEGFSMLQIADLFNRAGLADKEKFLEAANSPEILKKYKIAACNLEGYLYPDTYRMAKGLSAISVIEIMVSRFMEIYNSIIEESSPSGMSMEELVTLASIIEKETGKSSERPIISSVFHNRLKKGMKLESDPTVIYGIHDFNGNITKKDLNTITPYNTYIIPGLPPGPIANPGKAAIEAALKPEDTEYIFFVSKNDGTHVFSEIYRDHVNAVNKYQKKSKNSNN